MTEQEKQTAAVRIESRPPLAIIHLDRPAQRNQLSINIIAELAATVSALTLRADVSAIIFTGAGDVFASGANIRELQQHTPATAREFASRGQNLFQKIADAPQLTIAAVNGYCMGGGLDLALACDLRCASTDAIFAHPGARLGITTGWGGTQRLPRLVGAARAIEMFVTARQVNALEAYEMGLVSLLSDSVLDAACDLARNYLARQSD